MEMECRLKTEAKRPAADFEPEKRDFKLDLWPPFIMFYMLDATQMVPNFKIYSFLSLMIIILNYHFVFNWFTNPQTIYRKTKVRMKLN